LGDIVSFFEKQIHILYPPLFSQECGCNKISVAVRLGMSREGFRKNKDAGAGNACR